MHKKVIIFKYSACFSNNIVWCITYINTETLTVTPPTQLQAAGTIRSGYYFLHFSLEVRVKNESGLYLSAGTKRARTVYIFDISQLWDKIETWGFREDLPLEFTPTDFLCWYPPQKNCHRLKCDTTLESWCSEVSENMFYNNFAFLTQNHKRIQCNTPLKS